MIRVRRPRRDVWDGYATKPGAWIGRDEKRLTGSVLRSAALTSLTVAIGLLVLIAGLTVRLGDLHLYVVDGGSMQPTAAPGDIAITGPISTDTLAVGDVIAFYPPDSTTAVLHRITTLERVDGVTTVTTRGDANSTDDTWHASLREPAFHLVVVLPLIGWLTVLRGPLLIIGGLILGIAIIRETRRREAPLPSGPSPA